MRAITKILLATAAASLALASCVPLSPGSAARIPSAGKAQVVFSTGGAGPATARSASGRAISDIATLEIVASSGEASSAFLLPFDPIAMTASTKAFELAPGSWHFSARALSPAGKALYSGSADQALVAGPNAVNLVLTGVTDASSSAYALDLDFGRDLEPGQFAGVTGVAISTDGETVYAADEDNHWIQVIDISSGTPVYAESIGASNGWTFNTSHQIAASPDGSLWVADRPDNEVAHCVRGASGSWTVTKFGEYGVGNGQFKSPEGVAVDDAGNVYVADTGNDRVQVFGPDFSFLRAWGSEGAGEGQFYEPVAIAAWKDSAAGARYIYVLSKDRSIQQFLDDGSFLKRVEATETVNDLCSLAADAWGNVIATEATAWSPSMNEGAMDYWDKDLAFLGRWSVGGSAAGEVDEPRGIAISVDGTLIVAERKNHRIQAFTRGATSLVSAWTYGRAPDDDQFESPLQLRFDAAQENAYLLDRIGHRVKKYDRDGRFVSSWGDSAHGNLGYATDFAIREESGVEYAYVEDRKFGLSDGEDFGGLSLPSLGDLPPSMYWFWDCEAFDPADADVVYISNREAQAVLKVKLSTATVLWNSRLANIESGFAINCPNSLALASNGDLLALDKDLNRVVRLDPATGEVKGSFGETGSGPGQLNRPNRLAVDASTDGEGNPAWNVYVTDAGNRRVQVFGPDGGYVCSLGEGQLTSSPVAVAVKGSGEELWVTQSLAPYVFRFIKK